MAVAAEARAGGARPSLEEVRELAREHNLVPLHQTFIDDMPDAGLGVPQAARRRPGQPAFLLESADQGRVGRYSFIGFRPRKVLRWSLGDPGDPVRAGRRRARRATGAAAARRACRRSPAAPSACFAYDLVRTVEPLGRAQPRSARRARPGADADRRAGRLRPPQAHGHRARQRLRRRTTSRPPTRRAAQTIAEIRWRLDGPVPRPAQPAGARPRRARVRVQHDRASSSRRWSAGSSSTSTPATPSRSCPPSAGRRRCRSRRSRSTAACARSTPARTCTSWTSATSRSPAPAPSR